MKGWAEAVVWNGLWLLTPWAQPLGVSCSELPKARTLGGGASRRTWPRTEPSPSPGCGKWSWAGGRCCW